MPTLNPPRVLRVTLAEASVAAERRHDVAFRAWDKLVSWRQSEIEKGDLSLAALDAATVEPIRVARRAMDIAFVAMLKASEAAHSLAHLPDADFL